MNMMEVCGKMWSEARLEKIGLHQLMKRQFTIKYLIFREIWKIPCVVQIFPVLYQNSPFSLYHGHPVIFYCEAGQCKCVIDAQFENLSIIFTDRVSLWSTLDGSTTLQDAQAYVVSFTVFAWKFNISCWNKYYFELSYFTFK